MWTRMLLVLAALACAVFADTREQAIVSYLAAEPDPKTPVEPPSDEAPASNPWDFQLNLGFTFTDGNTEDITFTGGFVLGNEWERDSLVFSLLSVYRESFGVEVANRHTFFERYKRKLSEKSSLYQDLLLEHDSQEDLKIRVNFTLGYSRELVNVKREDKQVFVMNGEIGAGVLYELYSATEETNPILDLGLNWTWQITKFLKYEQAIKVWPSFKDLADYRVRWISRFTTPIAERWNISLEINDRYNSRPPVGNEKNDLLVALYVSYKFTKDEEE